MTGITSATTGIATTEAFHDTLAGSNDAYIARFGSFASNVKTITSGKAISLYPNPNNGNFTITAEMSALGNSVMSIMDDKGNVVYRSKVGGNRLEERISLPAISPGYLYHELNEQ